MTIQQITLRIPEEVYEALEEKCILKEYLVRAQDTAKINVTLPVSLYSKLRAVSEEDSIPMSQLLIGSLNDTVLRFKISNVSL